ncbi:MAG: hypothetical protein ABEJ77_03405 [Halanaeroarchaeum sp.]
MSAPDGQATFDRVVTGLDEPLRVALDRPLTGYAEVVPQAALLLDASGSGLLYFEEGVPVAARHTGTGATGPDALAALAATGPYRVRLVPIDEATVADRSAGASLPPDAPAQRLAGDEALARRTRRRAGTTETEPAAEGLDAVEAFLADDEKIAAIRNRARAEARRRAEEWGFASLSDETQDVEGQERDEDEPPGV